MWIFMKAMCLDEIPEEGNLNMTRNERWNIVTLRDYEEGKDSTKPELKIKWMTNKESKKEV